tara:strand:- start:149587 stop:151929 length:2343 start_codon:yes stop_codon:yes gene_type:complete
MDLLGIFFRRKWHFALGMTLGLALAALYYFITPPTFRAEMEILVGQKSGDVARGASSSASVEGVQAEEDILSTHIQLLTSRRILDAAMTSANLQEIASIKEAIEEGESAIVYLQENLKVAKGGEGVARDAHTLHATYDDPSPTDCAIILRAIFDEYEKYLKEHFEGTSTQAVDLLNTLVERDAQGVIDAERELTEFMGSTTLLWDGERSNNVHKDRLASIEESLVELTQTQAETESRLAVISDFLQSKEPQDITDLDRLSLLSENEVTRLQLVFDVTRGDVASEAFQAEQPLRQESARAEYSEYLSLVMREKKLRELFSDEHPQVISIQEQIALMRQFIDQNAADQEGLATSERMRPAEMLQTYQGLLKHDLDEILKRREVLLEKSRSELQLAKALEAHEMRANSLRRELQRRQDIYQRSQDTLKELSFVRDYAGFSTDVIGDAIPQDEPVWPRTALVGVIGIFFGGLLGLGLALLAELMDVTFDDPDDLSRSLGLPIYAHVPRFPAIRRSRKDPPLALDPSVYIYHRPRSPESEMYRVIRTNLFVDTRMGGQRVIQITSASPGDGKSTTAANLAIAIADTGKRVLLVDGDLRRPQVAKLMRLDSSPGIADVLLDQAEPSDAVQKTAVENLYAVTSGRTVSHPAELLENERLQTLMELWRDEFDYVIIDSPPVLAVSDASIIAMASDAVVFTTRIVKNGRKVVERAKTVLDNQRIPVLGVVVNGYSSKSGNYGYANGYDKNLYGYGYGEDNTDYYRNTHQKRTAAEGNERVAPSEEQVSV